MEGISRDAPVRTPSPLSVAGSAQVPEGAQELHEGTRLPPRLTWACLGICVLPFTLNLLGVDFGSPRIGNELVDSAALSQSGRTDLLHHALSGSFTHTLLEWTAFLCAVFTVILAWLHFTIRRTDVVIPVVGIALFCSGCVDAFHTLAADRLIDAVADNTNFIPFTWAVSRSFNALVMISGISLLLLRTRRARVTSARFVGGVSVAAGLAAWLVIHLCATSKHLPQTMFPDSLVTRPWDVAPLVLFVLAGATLYRRLYAVAPSYLSHALVIGVAAEIATQLHMAFGSTALFDNHFNIAHFLKIIAYLVPFSGLCMDYVRTHRAVEHTALALTQKAAALSIANQHLEYSHSELDDFAFVASHDLKEPLRGIHNYSRFLLEDCSEKLDHEGREKLETIGRLTQQMEELIDSLRNYSRLGRTELAIGPTSLQEVVDTVADLLRVSIQEAGVVLRIPERLPTVACDGARMGEVFRNLITNAMKYNDEPQKWIEIGYDLEGSSESISPIFYVRDNGIGIREKHLPSIFRIFKRLHARDKYGGGTGAGLTIVKKIVERHCGRIWVESTYGEGSTFYFTLGGREDEKRVHEHPVG